MSTAETYSETFYAELTDRAHRLAAVRGFMVGLSHQLIGSTGMRYTAPQLGQSQEGFDCSGFICHLIAQANEAHDTNLLPPRHADEQFRSFGEPVHYSQRIPGDLVYFPSRSKQGLRVIGHVGLVVTTNQYIHSPGIDGSVVSKAALPDTPTKLPNVLPEDIYSHTPAGIKRLSLPIGIGRWQAH